MSPPETTASSEETHLFGIRLASTLRSGAVLALSGDLGSGKTTLVRGIAEGIGGIDLNSVCSPTFTVLNIYSGNLSLYHFDLYRLPSAEAFIQSGFDEYFEAGGICCIEWADKILPYLPPHTRFLHLSHLSIQERVIQ